MPVKEDDQGSEQAMHGHWQYNGSVNGALNEAKGKWPSSVNISIDIIHARLGNWTFSASVWLSGQKELWVSAHDVWPPHTH